MLFVFHRFACQVLFYAFQKIKPALPEESHILIEILILEFH